ncbi:hypothetical protein AWB70_00506 [Caballeronia cordobensis]|uniref:GmrSD restriction endonucleases N-terminal domain-containing protein n=1 Tax=Caballeronia cordobensis TaxID=1353886 RepID=A0A158F2V0_CABCO|nr:DUF262 domain-containing protein [Caballeronia cordobensis]SAL14152.1 hypothetical protein AWB70_00506 [Caballeronia cordobensis]
MPTKKTGHQLADILFPEAREQQEFADGILSVPPEQRKLHTETYDFTVETIVEKLADESIYIPHFQRRYVWTEPQASRLVESLIIQCPIPVIYLNQENDERLSVIDGNQRLTTIKRFIENQFALKGLTAYPELEGSRFFELDPRFQRHIQNRTLRCIVILKDTHPQVKFDVFERLNTGAAKLTPQELRHGLYFGDLMTLAAAVVKESELLALLEIKNDKRMKAEELVLRFWALNSEFQNYRKPLATFINTFSEKNRRLTSEEQEQFKRNFANTLGAVRSLLGDLTFRIFDRALRVESSFNSALYDALMLGVAQLMAKDDLTAISTKKAQLLLAGLIEGDEQFRKSISIATSDDSQVRYRVNAIRKLFAK